MFGTEARLEGFIEVMKVEVGLELWANSSLKDFGQVGEPDWMMEE